MRAAILCFALSMLASSALAEDHKPWGASLGVGNVWIGGERPTGGLSIVGGARYTWPVAERVTIDAGVSLETFGFASGTYWMGVLGGPSVGASAELSDSWTAGLAADVAYGRSPACNGWGLCMRYWGLYPGGVARVGYTGSTVGIAGSVTVRYVDTLAWRGASIEPVVSGSVRW